MNKLIPICLCCLLACDKITEDAPLPEVSHQSVIYTRNNGKAIIGLFGEFDRSSVVISTNNSRALQIQGLPYVEYTPGENPASSETVKVELQNNNRIVGRADVSVVNVSESECVNSAFSDYHVIENDSTIIVNLLQNDYFCDFVDTGSGGVNMVPITNTDGSLIAISPGSAQLSYTAPDGFSGTVELIYELCYGFDGNPASDPWSNPVEKCEYYYTALATIEVIDPR